MSLLARASSHFDFLLIATALSLWNGSACAQDLKEIPEELRGIFVERPQDCDGWNGDDFPRYEIGTYVFTSCGAAQLCDYEVVDHVVTPTGYILQYRELGTKGIPTDLKVDILDADHIQWNGGETEILLRCKDNSP